MLTEATETQRGQVITLKSQRRDLAPGVTDYQMVRISMARWYAEGILFALYDVGSATK